jgi:enediyne biosynthesis protein E4
VTYKEPLLLFHQEPDGKLRNVSSQGGTAFRQNYAARGLAVGDYNNDGAVDVFIANNGGPPLFLKNNAAKGNSWVGLKLEGVKCNRDGIGAKIYWTAGGKRRYRLKNSGGSYLSSHDPREVLGIGRAEKIDSIEIHWPGPSTQVDRILNPPMNTYLRVTEGKGILS